MSTWNKRAVQGALIRLDQTGMVKRFRARRKDAEDNWLTCIEVLREPRPEDHENLKFRRQVNLDEAADEQSDEDVDGDTLMKVLEVDLLNSDSQEVGTGPEEAGRIPPQWIPERLLSNTLHDTVAMGGVEGWDSGMLRDRIVGKFWRRPMESYLTRLTDDWENTQPDHLRHLALIRDTRNTQEKKFVHYVYRTYGNFQKAVDKGEVIWAGVSKPTPKQSSVAKGGRPKKGSSGEQSVDHWGFRTLGSQDFANKDGSGSLSEIRRAIVPGRTYGPRWDNSLAADIGYQKIETPKDQRVKWTNDMSRSNAKKQAKLNFSALVASRPAGSPMTPAQQETGFDVTSESEHGTPLSTHKIMGLPKRKHDSGLLTIEQRIALGLKPKGRLSKFVEDQIRKHREQTGDSISIPDSIELEKPVSNSKPSLKSGPLMTKEERIAAGLPPRGRLGQKIENQLREQRGLPQVAEKAKKPRNKPSNEPALLSKEQRIKLGIIPHGRLPQSLMEGLREERDFDIPIDKSKVIPAYLSAVNDKKAKAEVTQAIDEARVQTLKEHDPSRGLREDENDDLAPDDNEDVSAEVISRKSTPIIGKRKADDATTTTQSPKRMRVEQEEPLEEIRTSIPTPPSTASADVEETSEQQSQNVSTTEIDVTPVGNEFPQQSTRRASILSPDAIPVIDLAQVSAKVRSIQEKYSNRSTPGVYVDPFAKRRIGKGRPRNAFVATFRLPGLSTFEWFAEDTNTGTEQPPEAVEQQSTHHAIPSPVVRHEHGPQDRDIGGDIGSEGAADQPDPGASSIDSAANDISSPRKSSVGADQINDIERPRAASLENQLEDQRTETTSEQDNSARLIHQHARPVVVWNAINKIPQPSSAYQSPYAPADASQPVTPDQVPATSDAIEQHDQAEEVEPAARTDANESPIQGVCGPISEADTASRSARKLAAYMGTKTGGGSQKMFRHKIIMQIIDLCNGVYPMHGEIGRPFTTLWKQQYPRTPPPNSSTVLSNLRDMIADPRNGLKKFSFLIRLRQSAGLKRKDMVVYQHLTPTSPQVTKLAYKMANFSNTKAHQYYPEEIRHLVSDESFYVPMPVAPKDETVSLERLNPSLQNKIKEANLERRRRYYHKQKNEESARDAQNAAVEAPLKGTKVDGQPRAKRTRLASLNDKNKRYRRAPLSNAPSGPMDLELEENIAEEASLAEDDAEHGQTLAWKEPWVGPEMHHKTATASQELEAEAQVARKNASIQYYASSITAPIVRFYATNGTFSTEFGVVRESDLLGVPPPPGKLSINAITKPKATKRVRVVEPVSQRPSKRARIGTVTSATPVDVDLIVGSGEESEDSYSSSTSTSTSDEEDDIPLMQVSKAQTKARAKAKAKNKEMKRERRNRKTPPPTLLERLTGLTGDPNDPVYRPPRPKLQSQKTYQGWSERKKARFNKQQRERKYAESQDPVDKFKKLCCTLVIAASMAGDSGRVDWSIVEKVHSGKGFNLAKTKALWTWMQTNMAPQLAELTADFEARFLEAYENNQIAAIEDPVSYDWANIVRWAMHTCVYPDMNLPVYREALQHFIIDLSSFEALDRPKWHREKIADRVRTQLQLQYPFTAPLHYSQTSRLTVSGTELKARSWIRANTATPQALYDSKTAHEKLKTLGDPVLAKVVGEYVERQMLRMRKLKRLLPGRNYTFTARLAKKYGRTFELGDFMTAVKVKKEMDAAFAKEDPDKRIYSISRAESDGAIMAIMSLLEESKVKFVPKVPSVNNEFGAPLPRLSVWGFMEGDYVHRGIDRQRMFWDIHVIPTETYDYGNPLQPASTPLDQGEANSLTTWSALPQPPLPGKHDANALLPIWSSMDGQDITWPWWYRILNLVLQPLIFQPGASVEDIHANCDEYTTEIFEIELVLQWLMSVNAVKQTIGGGYITTPGVWAAFGDTLHDMEDDWLNVHVQRKHRKHEKQQWREKYHLRYSTLQGRNPQRLPSDDFDESNTLTDDEREGNIETSTNIMRHPNEQYAIVREQMATAAPETPAADKPNDGAERTAQLATAAELEASEVQTADAVAYTSQDVEMADTNEGHEIDAEGEMDV